MEGKGTGFITLLDFYWGSDSSEFIPFLKELGDWGQTSCAGTDSKVLLLRTYPTFKRIKPHAEAEGKRQTQPEQT
jgi:hypothetical protein